MSTPSTVQSTHCEWRGGCMWVDGRGCVCEWRGGCMWVGVEGEGVCEWKGSVCV